VVGHDELDLAGVDVEGELDRVLRGVAGDVGQRFAGDALQGRTGHGGQGVAGQVVQLAGDASPLLGHGLFGQRLPGPFELGDEHLLATEQPAHREREHVGRRPRCPGDPRFGG